MRHEMSLALLITFMAALAAAESPPGGAAEATVVPGGPATEVATPRAGGHPEAYENKPGFREFCAAPRVVGPCRASFLRWYFDLESQTCKRFIFGGCRGNKNNYVLEEDCLSQCTGDGEVTEELGDTGAHPQLPSEPFSFSTRGGSAEATVVPGGPATKVATPRAGGHPEAYENKPGFREFCAAPQVVGPCRASFLRWYFDLESQTCKRFIFGGCRGNKNNYVLEEDCLSQCTGDGEVTEEPGDTGAHPQLPSEPFSFSTRAVVLAVLLAILMTILLGSMGVFFVKICRKNPDLSVGTVWSTLDDKEYLMSNAYTL